MQTINIHKAKTHLSKLVELAAKGEPFIIAKAGKPMVVVTAIEPPVVDTSKRFGWAADQNWVIPDDFDRWAEDEIAEMFGTKE
jgi:prevent-host-death family protein